MSCGIKLLEISCDICNKKICINELETRNIENYKIILFCIWHTEKEIQAIRIIQHLSK